MERSCWLTTMSFGIAASLLLDGCGMQSSKTFVQAERIEQLVARIPTGISRAKLEVLLNHAPTHEFTAYSETTRLSCISYSIGSPEARYYFLFVNDDLAKVVQPASFEYEEYVNYLGARARRSKPVDPKQRIQLVLEAVQLSQSDFVASVREQAESYRRALEHEDSMMVLPAAVLLAPLMAAQGLRTMSDDSLNVKLERLYDPFKVSLGMSVVEVNDLLGPAVYMEKIDDSHVRGVYGRDVELTLADQRYSWIEVQFVRNRASAIYSHDFFDERLRGRARGTKTMSRGNRVRHK